MADYAKFLQLLAKEIDRGADKFSFESLKTYLLESVDILPDGNLKNVLRKQSQENADYLWKLVKPANKYSEIQFNIFNKNGLDETLKNISEIQSYKAQVDYLSQAALCHNCPKIFELLLNAQKMENSDQSEPEVLSKVTELYGRLNVACHNSEVLHELMQVFLSEVDKINEKLKSSNEAQESWLDFKDIIQRFLVHCHIKRTTQKDHKEKDGDITSTEWTKYRDILAAIIAIYIDVIIAIGQIDENVNNHLSNMVFLLLGHSPNHILDAANQIFTLDSDTVEIVFPFLRKVFDTTKTCTTECPNYIKYVCLAWRVQNCVRNMEVEALYLKKTVYSLLPPENVLTWLSDVDSSLIKDFELSGLARHKITNKILQCTDEEKIDRILDLTSFSGKFNQTTEASDRNNETDRMDESESIFFVDAQGSSDLVEQCQEQEESTSSKNEKMLKVQINVLLEKLEETGSEADKDDFDIMLDDEPEKTFDFGDTEFKNIDEEVPDPSLRLDDATEGESEGEHGIDATTTREENESLTQSGRKRKKSKISNIFRNLRRRK